jgi:hypothetical protein
MRYFQLFCIPILLYTWVAWTVFSWRNPIANEMSFFRDFGSVMMFEKLDKYQTK